MKIRVLEILPTLKRAGAENMAVSLACRLDTARFEPAVVSLFDAFPGGLEPILEERGILTWHLGKRRGFDPRMWPRLARVLREFRPDVVHTHSYLLRYALPVRRGAIIHTVHNLAARESDGLGRFINRVAFRRGVLPVAVSKQVARSFREVYGFEPVATIPNGIDLRACGRPEARQIWRRSNGFAEDDVLIVSVARLEPQKDPEALIQAFSRGLSDDPRAHLLLAGDGSLRDAAGECAARCGIAGRVHFLGVRSDVPEILAAADLFALASRWEGCPLSVMEAMAAGLPVVAAAVGGVPELVEDGVTGILAPLDDTDALGRALALLANDPQRRRAMGDAARERAASFSLEVMVASYADLFEKTAGGRR